MQSLREYVLHCRLHRNEPRAIFKCVAGDCKQSFSKYGAFKSHFYRRHNSCTAAVTAHAVVNTDLICSVSLCSYQCQDVASFVAHLKNHIKEGRAVYCPVRGCKSVFHVMSSFTSHMSRKHRNCSVNSITDSHRPSASEILSVTSEQCPEDLDVNTGVSEVSEMGSFQNFDDLYLRNVSLFYMKLQGQFLLPASTIQNIVDEKQNIHGLGQTYTFSKLHSLLQNLSLPNETISQIFATVKESDLFSVCHKGPMRTEYSRSQTFKKVFQYVEPKRILLGRDENRTEQFAYYVPVKDTLKCLLNSDFGR